MKIRADERMSWSRYAQRKGTARDLHDVSVAIAWLQEQGIHSLDEFRQRFTETNEAVSEAVANVSSDRQALHSLEICRKHLSNRAKFAPIYEKYRGIYFKMFKEKFEQEHRQELESYRTAVRYFKAHPEFERMKATQVETKMNTLQKRIQEQEERLPALRQSLQPYLQVQRFLRLATEPPPMMNQEEQIRHEPERRKKSASDLSL